MKSLNRLRFGSPLTLLIAAGCVLGTYFPGASHFGISGNLASLFFPWTWLKLLTWPFVHANTDHLIGNLMFFLLLSPNLEKKQGALEYLFCLILTAVIIGIGHLLFGAANSNLIGASGWVFMMIILSTFTGGEAGTITVATILVALLYGGQEIWHAFQTNSVSQRAHLLGGACGLVFGFFGSAQHPSDQSSSALARK